MAYHPWDACASITFDASSAHNSKLKVHSGTVSADPPTVPRRRATWDVDLGPPRVLAQAFRFNLDANAVNSALTAGRGRGIVVRSLVDDAGPLCALTWHLDADRTLPILIRTFGVRLLPGDPGEVPAATALIDGAVAVAIDLLRWVAEKHRAWGLETLPPKIAAALRTQPVQILVNVGGRPAQAAYLDGLFAGRTTPHVVVPSGKTVLRIT